MGTFTRAALLAALTLAEAARAEPSPTADPPLAPDPVSPAAPRPRAFDAIGLPMVNYSTDLGLGLGLVGGAYFYAPGHEPYRHALGARTYFTTGGEQSHFIRYDGPGLLGPLRLEAQLELKRDLRMPYFGPGNRAAPEFAGGAIPDRFSYQRTSPRAWVRLRGHPSGRDHPFQLWVSYLFQTVDVRARELSLLAEAPPPGFEGGRAGQLGLGALWDTRDSETNPSRGGVLEVALRASFEGTFSDHDFAGLTLGVRRYVPLGSPALVLALRAVLDHQAGDVPFYDWAQVGGLSAAEGIGGMSSVRGVPRARFAGNTKAFANLELRWLPLSLTLLERRILVGPVAFADAGRVWQPAVDNGPWYAWHPGVGLGLRAVIGAAVLRGDWALSTETGRSGLYLTMGHMF